MANRLKQTAAMAAATLFVVGGLAACDRTSPSEDTSPTPTMSEDTMEDDSMESEDSMESDDAMEDDSMESDDAMEDDAMESDDANQ